MIDSKVYELSIDRFNKKLFFGSQTIELNDYLCP